MVDVFFDEDFQREFSSIKHNSVKDQVRKQINKITQNPEIGKPMRNKRKGTREVYIGSHRLSYSYNEKENLVIFLDFYHKDLQ